jgi:hypothetical protein
VKIARKYWIVLGLAAAVLLGSSSKASAQYYGRPRYYAPAPAYYPPSSYRNGLVLGGSIGFGGLIADQCGDLCGSGLSLEGHIGGMLNPQAALMFDVWTVIHPIPNTDGDTTSTLYTGALQFWLTPILWLKGGIGLGNTQISSNSVGTITDATAFAIMGGAGVELVQRGPFALDLQGRVGHTFFSNNDGGPITQYAFMIGFNWY